VASYHELRDAYWHEDQWAHRPHHHMEGVFLLLLLVTGLTALAHAVGPRSRRRRQMNSIVAALHSNPALKAAGKA
jgi:hypothetical protein